ncbi:TM2 domain-containing protein [Candidatus Arthromitus sp. SFB-rat-Yit]|uniref:TM2 domain-containing protein n=1 Tax=Candidatus Arthromitus sp. SFB-rat-Yit TaxID=1041504 RepID=UPI000227A064|nr:TM2 domain-containing protein [Candidatus Arthromitus sp. SFB-rat-Yit]BAK81199.1 TM2 domain protein [Candidatus Arthromitus sp. SFB-rat-Yit]
MDQTSVQLDTRMNNESFIDMFLLTNKRFLPSSKMNLIKEKLMRVDNYRLDNVLSLDFKDPITTFMFSMSLGVFGIDRFTIGSVGIGILKLLTFWFFGLPWFIDLFFIQNATKNKNYEKLLDVIG